MTPIKFGAAALALLVSTALPVEILITGDLFGVPTAEAGVLGKFNVDSLVTSWYSAYIGTALANSVSPHA
jgi:hypothetical protein